MMDSSQNSEYGAIFEVDPTEIVIHEELPRVRKEIGEVEKLLISIKKFGQMQPIVINRNTN